MSVSPITGILSQYFQLGIASVKSIIWTIIITALLLDTMTAHANLVSDDIAANLKQQELPGAVWVLVQDQNKIELGSAGFKNASTQQAMQASDRVHVGSIAKSFIALGILHLVTEGKLDLDTPLSQILPNIKLDNPWAASSSVTVRHLLDQTSGLDDARFWQVFSLNADPGSLLVDSFHTSHDLLRVRSRPGAHHSYSNMGYTLLGMVIEALTHERYEDYLDRELLIPLGMQNSTFHYVSQLGPKADSRLAMGHFEKSQPHAAAPMYMRPAGQFTTTAADMAKFLLFLMSDGTIGNKPFIDVSLLQAMSMPQGTDAAKAGLRVGYGLGMFRRDRLGVVAPCHGGGTVGFNAMFCIFPEQQKAFFVAINGDSEGADYTRIDAVLIHALALPSVPAVTQVRLPIDIEDYFGFYMPSPNRMQKFALLDTAFGFTRISRNGNALLAEPFQKDAQLLLPVAGGRLFRTTNRLEASHVLFTDAEGVQRMSRGTQSYQRMPLWKIGLFWASFAIGLLGIFLLLVSGLVRTVLRKWQRRHPALIPFLGIVVLAAPVPLFLMQSFLAIGDITQASILLLIVTAVLPLSMLFGIWQSFRLRPQSIVDRLELLAMISVLQCCLLLAYWGLLPLQLWA